MKIIRLSILIVGLAATGTACTVPDSNSSVSSGGRISTSSHTVTYKVQGSATGADLTMSTANGGTSQASGKAVPLRNATTGTEGISFSASRGTFLYISAQNTGESGTITCIIEVDGIEMVRNTSSGAYTIATCSDSL